ncbi:hypothetical protein HN51_047343 [Arachis hypogaea]
MRKVEDKEEQKPSGFNGEEEDDKKNFSKERRTIFSLSWNFLFDPDPDNVVAFGLIGILTWANVQVLWQLFNSFAILVAVIKYSFIAAFTFILSIICRMEKIDVKTRTTQAKIVGSIISIGGAFIVTFYKGPSIIIADDSPSLHLVQRLNGNFELVDTNWVIGGFLLTAGNILLTLWFILQRID